MMKDYSVVYFWKRRTIFFTLGTGLLPVFIFLLIAPVILANAAAASPSKVQKYRRVQATVVPRIGIVTSVGLNMRDGPSVQSQIIRQLKQGTIVEVLDQNADGTWVMIAVDGNEGWVSSAYLQINQSQPLLPTSTSASTATPAPTVTPTSQRVEATSISMTSTTAPPLQNTSTSSPSWQQFQQNLITTEYLTTLFFGMISSFILGYALFKVPYIAIIRVGLLFSIVAGILGSILGIILQAIAVILPMPSIGALLAGCLLGGVLRLTQVFIQQPSDRLLLISMICGYITIATMMFCTYFHVRTLVIQKQLIPQIPGWASLQSSQQRHLKRQAWTFYRLHSFTSYFWQFVTSKMESQSFSLSEDGIDEGSDVALEGRSAALMRSLHLLLDVCSISAISWIISNL